MTNDIETKNDYTQQIWKCRLRVASDEMVVNIIGKGSKLA